MRLEQKQKKREVSSCLMLMVGHLLQHKTTKARQQQLKRHLLILLLRIKRMLKRVLSRSNKMKSS